MVTKKELERWLNKQNSMSERHKNHVRSFCNEYTNWNPIIGKWE